MKVALALLLKKKPLATCMYGSDGYRPEAIVDAVNAARLHGQAQMLLLLHSENGRYNFDRYLRLACQSIEALQLKQGELEVKVTEMINVEQAKLLEDQQSTDLGARIDVFCKK